MNREHHTIKNRYRFSQKIQLAWWLLRTKLIAPKARLIRFPCDLRGVEYMDLGEQLTTGVNCRFEAFPPDGRKTLFFGKNVQVNDNVHISAMESVRIGDHVLMAGKIYISDNSHGYYKSADQATSPLIPPAKRPYSIKPVTIEQNVWIGEGVVIMPGVTIGEGSVIGANSVVTRSIPAASIAVGNPARVIKTYDHLTGNWSPCQTNIQKVKPITPDL